MMIILLIQFSSFFLSPSAHALEASLNLYNYTDAVLEEKPKIARSAPLRSQGKYFDHSLASVRRRTQALKFWDYWNKDDFKALQQAFLVDKNTCASNLLHQLARRFVAASVRSEQEKWQRIDILLHFARYMSLIDDTSFRLLTVEVKHLKKVSDEKDQFQFHFANTFSSLEWDEFSKKLKTLRDSCAEEAGPLMNEWLQEKGGAIDISEHRGLFLKAYEKKIISGASLSWWLWSLNRFRSVGGTTSFHFQKYLEKIDGLNERFPKSQKKQRQFFTSLSSPRSKHLSYREELYQSYSLVQIKMMGDLFVKLLQRSTLESAIVLYTPLEQKEIIPLTPQEHYRMIAKLLRLEIARLSQSQFFSNGPPLDFGLILTSAYELGHIKGEDIQLFAKVEEVWRPKETRKEWWMKNLTRYGSLAISALPPQAQIVFVISVMLTDIVWENPKIPQDKIHALF
jgi:hypothetical protein